MSLVTRGMGGGGGLPSVGMGGRGIGAAIVQGTLHIIKIVLNIARQVKVDLER